MAASNSRTACFMELSELVTLKVKGQISQLWFQISRVHLYAAAAAAATAAAASKLLGARSMGHTWLADGAQRASAMC